MLFISTEVGFASDCWVPSFSSANEATDAAKMNVRGTANCKTRFIMTSGLATSKTTGHPSESFHVFDQRLLVLIAEFSPIGVPAILDEVRAETDFQQFLLSLSERCIVVPGLEFSELLFRRALQNSINIRLYDSRKVL